MARNNPNNLLLPRNNNRMNSSPTKKDYSTLLARGYTARWLGGSGRGLLQPLSSDEIDKDLRHMQAHYIATQRYHQTAYSQWNRNELVPAVAHLKLAMPVRLDPDQDKRLQAQRKLAIKAEWQREALEQEYVSARAHYVENCQTVQQLQQAAKETVGFLQAVCRQRAQAVAHVRTRLQVARDAAMALEQRRQVLETAALPGMATSATPDATATSSHPLMDVWMTLEQVPNTKLVSKKVLPWKSRTLPPTPMGVPLLVSPASLAPEKSLAWAVDDRDNKNIQQQSSSGIWSRASKSLKDFENDSACQWLHQHVPLTIQEEDVQDETTEDAKMLSPEEQDMTDVRSDDNENISAVVDDLRSQVAWLESELQAEGTRNAQAVASTAVSRHLLDEWTAMMALVRQETEAVLYRHNVLLEDPDIVQKAQDRWAEQQEEQAADEQAVAAVLADAMAATTTTSGVTSTADETTIMTEDAMPEMSTTEATQAATAFDNANDGDDEGDGETWTGTKRPAQDESSPSSPRSAKRRKQ